MLEIDLIAEAERRYGKSLEEQHGERLGRQMRDCYRPTVHLHTPPRPEAEIMKNSWFGGQPTLPDDIAWPVYPYEGVEYPMSFVLQLDCAEVPRFEQYPEFPERGVLLFFFETRLEIHRVQAGIGDEGGKVIYIEEPSEIRLREMPESPPLPPLPEHLSEDSMFTLGVKPAKKVVFEKRLIEPVVCGSFEAWMIGTPRVQEETILCETLMHEKLFGIFGHNENKINWNFHHTFGARCRHIFEKHNKNVMKVGCIFEDSEFRFNSEAYSYYFSSFPIEEKPTVDAFTRRGDQ